MDLDTLLKLQENPAIPPLASGETVKVSVKVKEGDKERVQVFQGVVIKSEFALEGAVEFLLCLRDTDLWLYWGLGVVRGLGRRGQKHFPWALA